MAINYSSPTIPSTPNPWLTNPDWLSLGALTGGQAFQENAGQAYWQGLPVYTRPGALNEQGGLTYQPDEYGNPTDPWGGSIYTLNPELGGAPQAHSGFEEYGGPVGVAQDLGSFAADLTGPALFAAATYGMFGGFPDPTSAAAAGTAAAPAIPAGLSQAELAALLESGTAGTAGAALEGAALGTAPAAPLALADAGMDMGMYNPGLANPYVTGAAGAETAAATNAAAASGGAATGAATGGVAGTAGAAAAGSAVSRILNGTATTADYVSVFGTAAATALGYYGASEQTKALSDLAEKYFNIGAPSRERYEATFKPDFKVEDIPGYTGAVDTSMNALLRRLSAQGGNPWGNPGGLSEALKYVSGNVALPTIQNYRAQLANTGGYSSFNTAAPTTATGAIGAGADRFNVIGAGLADLTQPRRQSMWDIYGNTQNWLPSDRRLKSNIVRIGTHPLGIGIYEYDIFERRERGVMADELETVMPEAVVTMPNGYKAVNYAMIGTRPCHP